MLYALERLRVVAPARAVAIMPSDHYVSDDAAFMTCVERAVEAVETLPGYVVLLGIEPDCAETGYGWIEPAELVLPRWSQILRVGRFWEKPPRAAAEALMRGGGLWNSFVTVAHPATLAGLIRRARPDLASMFAPLVAHIDTPSEAETAGALYATLPAADLSKDVLETAAGRLAVLPVTGMGWSDLGVPARVLAARQSHGLQAVGA